MNALLHLTTLARSLHYGFLSSFFSKWDLRQIITWIAKKKNGASGGKKLLFLRHFFRFKTCEIAFHSLPSTGPDPVGVLLAPAALPLVHAVLVAGALGPAAAVEGAGISANAAVVEPSPLALALLRAKHLRAHDHGARVRLPAAGHGPRVHVEAAQPAGAHLVGAVGVGGAGVPAAAETVLEIVVENG